MSSFVLESIDEAPDFPPPGTEDFTDPDNVCAVKGCAKPVKEYGGRGKRPTKCEEHSTRGGTRTTRSGGRGDAQRAAEVLAQLNALAAFGMIMGGLPMSGQAVSTANDGFKDLAVAALELDPALCRTILRAGAKSGAAALIAAYAQLGMAVIPVMMMEIKAKRAAEGEG